MDKRLKNIYENLDKIKIGIDEPFKFNCTMCGKCCINREDILLTAKDVFKMAKYLDMQIPEFIKQNCEVYIGESSRIPIVRLLPIGPTKRCPLLKGNRCSVHSVKPAVCAMFPIGRCLKLDDDSKRQGNFTVNDIQYIFTNPNCGDKRKQHTVREWLKDFDMETEDEYFIKWHKAIAFISEFIRNYEKKGDNEKLESIWDIVYISMYLLYDFEQDFLAQFICNSEMLIAKLKELK